MLAAGIGPMFSDGWVDEKALSSAKTRARAIKEVKIGRNIGIDLVHYSKRVGATLYPTQAWF